MKNTKKFTGSLLGLAVLTVLAGTASANFEGRNAGGEDRFAAMQAIYQSATSYEDFQAKMEVLKAEKQSEREAFKASITKTVNNLSNGVEVTMTSTDSAVVEKLQNKPVREAREGSEVTHTQVNISNGVKTTITTDNAELVEKIQTRASAEKQERGQRGEGKRGGKRGQRGAAQE